MEIACLLLPVGIALLITAAAALIKKRYRVAVLWLASGMLLVACSVYIFESWNYWETRVNQMHPVTQPSTQQ